MRRFILSICIQILLFSTANATTSVLFPSEMEILQKVDIRTGKMMQSGYFDGTVTDHDGRVLKIQGNDSLPYYFFYRDVIVPVIYALIWAFGVRPLNRIFGIE